MKRRIIPWVATGAVVLGIGAAGVGAVVANCHSASAQSSTPVAAAPARPHTTTTAQASIGQGSLLQPQGETKGRTAAGRRTLRPSRRCGAGRRRGRDDQAVGGAQGG